MKEINKEGLVNHIKGLNKKSEPKPHNEILKSLLDMVEVVDYKNLAFPKLKDLKQKSDTLFAYCNNQDNKKKEDYNSKAEEMKAISKEIESFKLNEKHFLIITIEELVSLTEREHWGLCKHHSFIYLFNGAYWKSIDKDEFQKFLGEASEKMGVGKFTAKFFRFRENLFKQFISSEYLPAPQRQKDKVSINLLNGTFDISEKPFLRPFDSSDFIKYQLPFPYDATATAPKFTAYLDRVLPEKDKQKVLAEYLGYIFVSQSQLKLEKALFLYGSGANGKSVLYEIVRALFGTHNTSEYTLQSLTDNTGYYRAQIADKLVNYASEISGKLDSTKFKSLASGEPMEARLPYGQPMIIEDYAKLIFNTNELPKEVEFNNAFFRRFIIIPFEVTIPENEQNKNLHQEIIGSELPGVFNWVLDGLKRLLSQKRFSDCPSIDKALEEFRTESDTVKRFLDEVGYLPDPEKKILLKDIYHNYREFAVDEEGQKFLLSKQSFRKRLEALKIHVKRESEGMQVFVSQNYLENGTLNF